MKRTIMTLHYTCTILSITSIFLDFSALVYIFSGTCIMSVNYLYQETWLQVGCLFHQNKALYLLEVYMIHL